ncbi:hypothetical protein K439DRAFT_1280352, partial [Ramaria rubella]
MQCLIEDLVSSIDPNVRVEPEVKDGCLQLHPQDLLLDIADESIDSVMNCGCRFAKHHGGDALKVCDLQLHL